jgi:glycosyltransferase involved in cell wall biosynthesis
MLSERTDVDFHIVTNRQTGLEDLPNVKVHRDVSDESLRELYQRAGALLLPLTNATANNCLMEGLACGLPVVATRLPSIMAYVDDGSAYLVPANDPSAFVRAILLLREDAAAWTAMSRAARARAASLAWPRAAAELQGLYEWLVRGSPRGTTPGSLPTEAAGPHR